MAFKAEGGAHGRTAITIKMLRFERRLDNRDRDRRGLPPQSLLDKWERERAEAARRQREASAA